MNSSQQEIWDFLKPENLTELSRQDILIGYQMEIAERLAPNMYFIDRESDTMCGLMDYGENLFCLRMEGRNHRCTLGLVRKMRRWLASASRDYGKPIYVMTAKQFYEKGKAQKLLALTGFTYHSEYLGHIVSRYTGHREEKWQQD